MDQSHDITILNTLIATTLDSVEGYRTSADASENPQHQMFFRETAEERSGVATQLQDQVRSLGGDPATDGSTAGAVHRTWVNLKSAVTGRDEQAIVNEVERGEDYIKAKFEAAIGDDDLSPVTRSEIEQCFESIREGHDRASAMKHALA